MAAKKQSAKAPKSYTHDELDGMAKEELVILAEKRGLTVARSDGEEGEPLKDDYVAALSSPSDAGTAGTGAGSEPIASRIDHTIRGGKYQTADGRTVNAEGKEIDEDGNLVEDEG